MPRPSLYTPEIVKEICDRLCTGEPLEQICRDDHMPSATTIHEWTRLASDQKTKVKSVPEYVSGAIAGAREVGYDAIANGARMVARGLEGSTGDVARDKLIIETDLKLLAKWHAKKYGDSTTIKGDKDNPIALSLAVALEERIAKRLTDRTREVIEGEAVDVTDG